MSVVSDDLRGADGDARDAGAMSVALVAGGEFGTMCETSREWISNVWESWYSNDKNGVWESMQQCDKHCRLTCPWDEQQCRG